MADINHVVLVGRLTRDAELRYVSTGTAVCKFSIAVNRRRRDGDQWVEEASFFDVNLWGRAGEALNQYLIKGKQVGIQGELRQNRWEQDGQTRSKVEIVALNVQLLGGSPGTGGFTRESRQEGQQSAYRQRAASQGAPRNAAQEPEPFSDFDSTDFDEIPF